VIGLMCVELFDFHFLSTILHTTYIRILKFTLNFKLFFTSLVHYMFQLMAIIKCFENCNLNAFNVCAVLGLYILSCAGVWR
jgi:hypothetical protein